jgi:hypothetical protein
MESRPQGTGGCGAHHPFHVNIRDTVTRTEELITNLNEYSQRIGVVNRHHHEPRHADESAGLNASIEAARAETRARLAVVAEEFASLPTVLYGAKEVAELLTRSGEHQQMPCPPCARARKGGRGGFPVQRAVRAGHFGSGAIREGHRENLLLTGRKFPKPTRSSHLDATASLVERTD